MPFFIIFMLIPFIEIAVFIAVGDVIGIGTTLLLAFFTAILGGAIIRHQGLQVLAEGRGAMRGGALPAKEIFDGFCLVAAGATLITPGFVTDTIGFLLLIPALRDKLREALSAHFTVTGAESHFYSGTSTRSARSVDPNVIEAEYVEVDEDDGGAKP